MSSPSLLRLCQIILKWTSCPYCESLQRLECRTWLPDTPRQQATTAPDALGECSMACMQLGSAGRSCKLAAWMILCETVCVGSDCSYCKHVRRWDCHGLPVEHEIDKAFGALCMTSGLYSYLACLKVQPLHSVSR